MKVMIVGHCYELSSMEGKNPQTLQFIQKTIGEKPGELITLKDGTTNEEVIKVLIDRLNYLNNKMPCKENIEALEALSKALNALESRTSKRKAQGVEGTSLPMEE